VRADDALQVVLEGEREVITLKLPQRVSGKVFTLTNPDRLVVDTTTLPKGTKFALPAGYGGKLLRSVRSGQFDPKTTRIVFDLAYPPGEIDTKTESGRFMVIRIALSAKPGAAASRPPALAPPVTSASKEPVAPKPLPKKEEKKDPRPVVVIDAGHGGQDPGTIARGGTHEKDIVLDYARALRKALLATGKYRVHMTRDSDEFILLRKRIAIAKEHGGDLFISLHADSAPENAARGLSVYTLSEQASDAEAEALAARENKVDAVYGLDLSDQSKDVADILISLAQRDTNNRSALLASTLVDAVNKGGVKLLPNTHRFAGFAVLKSPDIPSVLVEIGFLSNPAEEKLIKGKAYRDKVVKALVRGIEGYFVARRKGNGA
jgi:N-acetylmuramoyl-L-alanine amidase